MEILAVILALVGFIIAIFWIALPFLVNGTNGRLDRLIEEVRLLRNAVEAKK